MKRTKDELYREWLAEEKQAQIKGWDFSHIRDRYSEETDLPWDFGEIIHKYLRDEMKLLDMETGGGEFLLSLDHPAENTAAIEAYPPNVEYCKEQLLPLGIDFKEADGEDPLPFPDNSFDVVTNRHGAYSAGELKRILKSNGLFLTQQVGAENDRELVALLVPENKSLPFPEQFLHVKERDLLSEGFEILEKEEVYLPIRFFDVGALVWFARIIEWEFEGFSVDHSLENLYRAQEILEKNGVIEGQIHRFYLVARNK